MKIEEELDVTFDFFSSQSKKAISNNWSLREDAPGGQLARQNIKVVTVTQTYLQCSCGESLYPPFPLEFL